MCLPPALVQGRPPGEFSILCLVKPHDFHLKIRS